MNHEFKLIPFITSWESEESGFDFYNHNNFSSAIDGQLFLINNEEKKEGESKPIGRFFFELKPFQHVFATKAIRKLMIAGEESKYSLVVDGPKNLLITAVYGETSKRAETIVFSLKNKKLEEIIIPSAERKMKSWEGVKNPFWHFIGDYPLMELNYKNVMEYIIKSVYFDFPNRKDRCLPIYNCTAVGEEMPYTIYFPYFNHERNDLSIWKGDKINILLDKDRQAIFFQRIKMIFPKSKIILNDKVKESLIKKHSFLKNLGLKGTEEKTFNTMVKVCLGKGEDKEILWQKNLDF